MKKPTKPKSGYSFTLPIIVVLILGALYYWAVEIHKPSSYSVCLQGFNYTDRIIDEYRVNGLWGGNVSAKEADEHYGGGGKLACVGSVGGKTATIMWKYGMPTLADYHNGVKPETHEVTLPMPVAQSNHARYFQVHFFPDNHVELKLLDHS
jgi:hypothetical protein